MIEKRFRTNEVGCIVDLKDPQLRNYDGEEIVDLLNELAEENEELKNDNELFSIKIGELFAENEQLKECLRAVREELSLADRENTLLEEENEKLKMLVQRRIMR